MLALKEPSERATGNEDVIKMLESWLKRAKEHGQIGFAAIIAAENLRHVVSDYAGSMQLAFALNWGIDTVKYQLLARTHSQHDNEFESPNSTQADRICYDISAGPACYDFIVWLVLAEINRRMHGAPAPLKVGFKMLSTPSERALHDKERAPFYKNVIFPSLALVGAVSDVESTNAPTMEKYTLRPIVEFARAGVEVPLLTAPADEVAWVQRFLYGGTDRRAPIVITLREVKERWEHRNSNMTEWLKFSEYLEQKGERVLFVRDTDRAAEKIAGYQICPAASKDVRVRMALYEAAKCNLFVSNGPMVLSLFGSRPWLMFVETDPMSIFYPETPQWWKQYQGLDRNGQFPWSKPNQRIAWKRDNFENIVEAWEKLYPLLDSNVLEAAE